MLLLQATPFADEACKREKLDSVVLPFLLKGVYPTWQVKQCDMYFLPVNRMSRTPAANRKRVSKMQVIPREMIQ